MLLMLIILLSFIKIVSSVRERNKKIRRATKLWKSKTIEDKGNIDANLYLYQIVTFISAYITHAYFVTMYFILMFSKLYFDYTYLSTSPSYYSINW